MSFIRNDIEPTEVLYAFGEPLIFFSNHPLYPLLCTKISERRLSSYYLCVSASDRLIRTLEEGKVSLKAAFFQPWCWIVRTDKGFEVEAAKGAAAESLPEHYFADPGVGLLPEHGVIRDEHYYGSTHDSFIHVKFRGGELREDVVPLALFKQLIDALYGALQKVFVPTMTGLVRAVESERPSENTLRKMLYLPMEQPKLASLSVRINRPSINSSASRKRLLIDYNRSEEAFEKRAQFFLDQADELRDLAQKDTLLNEIYSRDDVIVDALQRIVPELGGPFSRVDISHHNRGKEAQTVTVDSATGQRIRNAATALVKSYRTVKGRIVEFNLIGESFIIRPPQGRDITCSVPFKAVREALSLHTQGSEVTVSGRFVERVRRDYLYVEKVILPNGDVIDRHNEA